MDSPGPGQYDISSKINGPKWVISKLKNQSKVKGKSDGPGPGSYDIPQKFADVPKYLQYKIPKFQY